MTGRYENADWADFDVLGRVEGLNDRNVEREIEVVLVGQDVLVRFLNTRGRDAVVILWPQATRELAALLTKAAEQAAANEGGR